MRNRKTAMICFGACLCATGFGCGEDELEPLPLTNSPSSVVVEGDLPPLPQELRRPQHGGTVVVAEDHAVEILTHPEGEVRAYVLNVDGAPPPGPSTQVTVNLHGHDREVHPVALTWSDEGYYRGHLVDVRPAPGPANVVVTVSGRPRVGHVRSYVVLPRLPRARVHVEAPGRPQVDVRVNGPRPPRPNVQVNINAPRPPGVDIRVGQHHRGMGWMHGHYMHRGMGMGRGRH